jgi:hypothetical protein
MRRCSEVCTFGEHGCNVGKVTWHDAFHDGLSGLDLWEIVTVILAILYIIWTGVLASRDTHFPGFRACLARRVRQCIDGRKGRIFA